MVTAKIIGLRQRHQLLFIVGANPDRRHDPLKMLVNKVKGQGESKICINPSSPSSLDPLPSTIDPQIRNSNLEFSVVTPSGRGKPKLHLKRYSDRTSGCGGTPWTILFFVFWVNELVRTHPQQENLRPGFHPTSLVSFHSGPTKLYKKNDAALRKGISTHSRPETNRTSPELEN
ncbi:hypothetical protein V6N12_058673 [Hibiscus sabdariffa]|uniref:Uncharacterized protein n=1 Tax=Hibiscus sabdariffa TaxID=183260 RepID=A0ABR2EUN3_9ROSI